MPLLLGFLLVRIRASDVATLVWLAGLVWFMVVGLWILDMPTGPGACYHCGASEKLWFTFFSLDKDSGMIDGQGRFIGTWPAVAMIGYSIGARLAARIPKLIKGNRQRLGRNQSDTDLGSLLRAALPGTAPSAA